VNEKIQYHLFREDSSMLKVAIFIVFTGGIGFVLPVTFPEVPGPMAVVVGLMVSTRIVTWLSSFDIDFDEAMTPSWQTWCFIITTISILGGLLTFSEENMTELARQEALGSGAYIFGVGTLAVWFILISILGGIGKAFSYFFKYIAGLFIVGVVIHILKVLLKEKDK